MTDIEKLEKASELLNTISDDWYYVVDDWRIGATGHLRAINRKTKEVVDLGICPD